MKNEVRNVTNAFFLCGQKGRKVGKTRVQTGDFADVDSVGNFSEKARTAVQGFAQRREFTIRQPLKTYNFCKTIIQNPEFLGISVF